MRYEIAGGPSAGFGADGARSIEIITNAQGQASADLVERNPEAGTTSVAVQLSRPAAGGVEALTIGNSKTTVTWAAAPSAVRISGPTAASVGSTASYRIDVTNSGQQLATHVVVSDNLPAGLTLLQSTPPADNGGGLQWTLGDIKPGETHTIQLDMRPEQAGSFSHCVRVQSAEGLTGQSCVTTVVQPNVAPAPVAAPGANQTVDLQLKGPATTAVGSEVQFELDITNRGTAAITDLKLIDRFDDGLVHAAAVSPIQREPAPIAAGETRRIGITFKVTKAGRLCQQIELTGAGGLRQTTSACVQADAGANPAPPSGAGLPSNPGAATVAASPVTPRPALTLKLSGPPTTKVGETIQFIAEIRNTGDIAIPAVRVSNSCDTQTLRPTQADKGYTQIGSELVWNIQNLAPGKVEYRRIECQCLDAATRACDRVTITDGGDIMLHDEACVQIAPSDNPAAAVGGNLTVQISARTNPLKAGTDSSYQCVDRGTNYLGTNSERKVALTVVTIPDSDAVCRRPRPEPSQGVDRRPDDSLRSDRGGSSRASR